MMTNLIAVNKPSASTVAASAAPNNGAPDTQTGKTFGAILARQVSDNPPNAADAPQPGVAGDKEALADKSTVPGQAQDDQHPSTPAMPSDPTGNLIALLQPFQEIRTPNATVAPDEAKPAKGSAVKAISHSLSANGIDSRVAEDAPGTGLPQTNVATLDGNPIDGKDLSANIVRFAAVSNAPNFDHQAALPLVQNIAAFAAPNILHSALPALPGTSGTAATSAQSINTPLGGSGWADEFSQKISWMTTAQQDQVAELHLNPPDLGPLDVVLKVSDNQATALFTSPHSAVREAVENAMPKLRDILADNGITLGNATVSDQPQRDGNTSAFTGQQSASQGGRRANADESDNPVQPAVPRGTVQRHNGMVDTFA